MRLGFREPFADEPAPLQTPLLSWHGGEKNRDVIIRFREDISRLEVFVLSESSQFVIWQLWLHFICNWNWHTAASVNISQEGTNSERSEVGSWQRAGHTGSDITGGWHWCWWTMEQEVTSAEDSELETQSHVMLCVPTWPEGEQGWGCSHSQHGASPRGCMNLCPCSRPWEKAKRLFVQREMSANQLMELPVEVWVLCSLQLFELCEAVSNSDGTWQVESLQVLPRKEHNLNL